METGYIRDALEELEVDIDILVELRDENVNTTGFDIKLAAKVTSGGARVVMVTFANGSRAVDHW